MLINNDIIKNIDAIVERAYISFLYKLVGSDFLTDEQKIQLAGLGLIIGDRPLIEILYTLVRQRSEERYHKDENLNRLLEQIKQSGILPTYLDTDKATVDIAKLQMQQTIDNSMSIAKKQIKDAILNANIEEKQRQTVTGFQNIQEEQTEKYKGLTSLMGVIGTALLLSQKQFTKDITGNLTDFVNNTVTDEAIKPKLKDLLLSTEQLVYKKVVNDGRTCSWCNSFYNNPDGTPRIFKVSELQANGTNDGKKKSAWLPTIGKTHPNCRCMLVIYVPQKSR